MYYICNGHKCILYNTYLNVFLAKNKENKSCASGFNTDTDRIYSKDKNNDETNPKSREDLLMKLKSLAITEDDDDDSDNSDIDDERKSDNFDSDIDDLSYDEKCSK